MELDDETLLRQGLLETIRRERQEPAAARTNNFFVNILQDLHYALRQIQRNPGFALVAIITLALGIGASTAIFSVIYNVLLEPFPYKDAGEIIHPRIHASAHSWHNARSG